MHGTLSRPCSRARASDMPSKSVGGRKFPGGFDSRPPPLRDSCVDQHGCTRPVARRVGEDRAQRLRKNRSPTPVFEDSQVFADYIALELDKSFVETGGGWASLLHSSSVAPSSFPCTSS